MIVIGLLQGCNLVPDSEFIIIENKKSNEDPYLSDTPFEFTVTETVYANQESEVIWPEGRSLHSVDLELYDAEHNLVFVVGDIKGSSTRIRIVQVGVIMCYLKQT
jgi:hypothetical protein